MGSLYVVRHGQASFGATDYDALSKLGEEQARILGARLQRSGLRFDRVFQGSMKRHRETARLALAALPPTLVEDAPWLDEFDHNAVMRALHPDFADPDKVRAFMKQHPEPAKAFHKEFERAMQRWMAGQHDADYPETYAAFQARCLAGLRDLLRGLAPDSNALLFTSGGPISRLLQIVLDFSDAKVLQLNGAIVNASLTRLPFKGEQVFLSYFNDHSHFDPSQITFR